MGLVVGGHSSIHSTELISTFRLSLSPFFFFWRESSNSSYLQLDDGWIIIVVLLITIDRKKVPEKRTMNLVICAFKWFMVHLKIVTHVYVSIYASCLWRLIGYMKCQTSCNVSEAPRREVRMADTLSIWLDQSAGWAQVKEIWVGTQKSSWVVY